VSVRRTILLRRPIRSAPVLRSLIGKEGNKLLERQIGQIVDLTDYRTHYTDPGDRQWTRLVLPILRKIRETRGPRFISEQAGVTAHQERSGMNVNWPAAIAESRQLLVQRALKTHAAHQA
jgi:hypothetical protein